MTVCFDATGRTVAAILWRRWIVWRLPDESAEFQHINSGMHSLVSTWDGIVSVSLTYSPGTRRIREFQASSDDLHEFHSRSLTRQGSTRTLCFRLG